MHIQTTKSTDVCSDTTNVSYSFLQMSKASIILKTWILLDNQLMVDISCNVQLLHNIHTTKTSLHIHCNMEITTTNKQGELDGCGMVWYHPDGIVRQL